MECPECGGTMEKYWNDDYGQYEWHCGNVRCNHWEEDEED